MLQLWLDLFGDTAPVSTPVVRAPSSAPPAPAPVPAPVPSPAATDFEPNSALAPESIAQTATQNVANEAAVNLPDALPPALFAHPCASGRIRLTHADVAYELRRGKRRTIGLQIGPEGLSVSAPRWTPLGEIEAALREKERWIVTKLGESRQRQARLESARIEWREGAEVPFLGAPVVLVIDPRQRHGRGGAVLVPGDAALPGVPAKALHIGLAHGASAEQLRDTVQAWLMRQARRLFTERLDHFAPQLGVRWNKLSLSSAHTRWGSASADGSIRLNWRLIHFRLSVIDYVVVHELAHLREMNHSSRFWQHVEDVLPDFAERRAALKGELVAPW